MAKKGKIESNLRKAARAKLDAPRREELKKIIKNNAISLEERFAAQLQLSSMSRDGSKVRYRKRCAITGRPRGYYGKFEVSRIKLRDLASNGEIPGMYKSQW